MTGRATANRIDEQCPVGTNSGDDTTRRLGAFPAEREIALGVACELVVREWSCCAGGGTECGNHLGEHVDALCGGPEPSSVEASGRAHVDADADGDPVEPRTAPSGLDEYPGQLSRSDVDIVGPLEPRGGAGKTLERRRDAKRQTQGEDA